MAPIVRAARLFVYATMVILALMALVLLSLVNPQFFSNSQDPSPLALRSTWIAPDSTAIPNNAEGNEIRYGKELVSHTASFLGPKGKVAPISNGMNCQNCHLKAGRKVFGNNYSAVASTYPKFRARSGSIETIEKRVNDCIERSLNGKKLDENSRELKAFVAYIKWVGQKVEKNVLPVGAGIIEVPPLERAADPAKGIIVYEKQCAVCHGKKGEGMLSDNKPEWRYPPLYGNDSYNEGAGLFRLSRFAGFVKANMPNGASYESPVLSDEEAWDVAAYVNSLPRPSHDISRDWPDIKQKPFDHPFGPFADSLSETRHKYGPFARR